MANYKWTFQADVRGANTGRKAMEGLSKAFQRFKDIAGKFKHAFRSIFEKFAKFRTRAAQAGGGANKAASFLKLLGGTAGKASKFVTNLAGSMGIGASAAGPYGVAIGIVVGILSKLAKAAHAAYRAMYKHGGQYELLKAEMTAYLTVAGETTTSIKRLAEEIETLSKSPFYNLEDVQKSALVLIKQGNSAAQVMEKLQATMDLAASSGKNTAAVATAAGGAFEIFGKSLEETGRGFDYVTQRMAAVSAASPVKDVVVLGQGFGRAGAEMLAAGVNFDQFTVLMSQASQVLKQGSQAGRGLAGIYKNLTSSGKKYTDALKLLNTSVYDTAGNLKEWPDILKQMQAGWGNLGAAEQMHVLNTLGGQFKGILKHLITEGVAGFEEMSTKIDKSTGALAELKEQKLGTMISSVREFGSQLKLLWATASRLFSPAIQEFWRSTGGMLDTVQGKIKALADQFEDMYHTLRGSGKSPLDAWISAIRKINWGDLWIGMSEGLKPHVESMAKLLTSGLGTALKFVLESAGPAAFELGQSITNGIWAGLKGIPGMLLDVFKGAIVGLQNMFYSAFLHIFGKLAAPLKKLFGIDEQSLTLPEVKVPEIPEPDNKNTKVPAPSPVTREREPEKSEYQQFRDQPAKKEASARQSLVRQLWTLGKGEHEAQALANRPQEARAYIEAEQGRTSRQEQRDKSARSRASVIQALTGKSFDQSFKQAETEQAEQAKAQYEQKVLEKQQLQVGVQRQLVEAKQMVLKMQDPIVKKESELEVAIIKQKAALQKALIEPFDRLKSKILEIREKFQGIISGLKGRGIDLKVKFLGLGKDEASKQRLDLVKKDLADQRKLLATAQTAEEKGRILSQMSALAEKAAETATNEGDKRKFGQQAYTFNKQNIGFQEKQREDQVQAQQIAMRARAEEIKLLEKRRNDMSTDAGKAKALEQLQGLYIHSGRATDAANLQRELNQIQRKAAGEQVNILKMILEETRIGNKIRELGNKDRISQSQKQIEEMRRSLKEQNITVPDPLMQTG